MQLQLNNYILIKEKDNNAILAMKDMPKDFIFDLRAIKRHLKRFILNTESSKDIKCDLLAGLKPIENDFVLIEKKNIQVSFNEKGINNIYLALIFAGYLTSQILRKDNKNLKAYSHIKQLGTIKDLSYYDLRKEMIKSLKMSDKKEYSSIQSQLMTTKLLENLHEIIINKLNTKEMLPTFDISSSKEMLDFLQSNTKSDYHGSVETIIIGLPKNLNKLKRIISDYLFIIEPLKGLYFGKEQEDKKESIFINKDGGIINNVTTGDDLVIDTKINLSNDNEFKSIGNTIPLMEALIYLAIYHTKKKC